MDIHGGQVWSVVIPNQNIMLKGKTFMFSFLMIHLLEHGFTGSKYRYPLHIVFFFSGATAPSGLGPPYSRGFQITQRCTTVIGTALDKWLAHCRHLYLTAHNTHNRQTSVPPVGFEPAISADEQPQTYALDRAATGTGLHIVYVVVLMIKSEIVLKS